MRLALIEASPSKPPGDCTSKLSTAPSTLNEHPSKYIGTTIRDLRMQCGLSQGEIAKRTGLFRSYISRVEHGRTIPTLETLYTLSQAMEIPITSFFTCAHLPENSSMQNWQEEQDTLFQAKRFINKLKAGERRLLLTLIHDLNTDKTGDSSRPDCGA